MDRNLNLKDVVVHFKVKEGTVKAVDHVNICFREGEITGLMGESGCGKSVLAMAILGLLPSYARTDGEICLEGKNLLDLSQKEMRKLRGRKIGLIPQNPAGSFNPVRKIGSQITEAMTADGKKRTRREKEREASALLEAFGFIHKDAAGVLRSYPFQLSGGMLQRAAAAMGTAAMPEWILADEPSKGLEGPLRCQLYETLAAVKKRGIRGMILITHDWELAARLCDRVAVMYGGQIIEMGKQVIKRPRHPYTKGLLASLPANGMNPMPGRAPVPWEELKGCRFAPRCPKARPCCTVQQPPAAEESGEMVRCFLYD